MRCQNLVSMCAAPKPAISPEGVALRENCSIRDIVQRALESYELRNAGREPAASFYAHFAAASHVDVIDIDAVIRENRRKHARIDL